MPSWRLRDTVKLNYNTEKYGPLTEQTHKNLSAHYFRLRNATKMLHPCKWLCPFKVVLYFHFFLNLKLKTSFLFSIRFRKVHVDFMRWRLSHRISYVVAYVVAIAFSICMCSKPICYTWLLHDVINLRKLQKFRV